MAGSLERVARHARVAQYTGFMVSVGNVFVYVHLCLLPGALSLFPVCLYQPFQIVRNELLQSL
jgi:hypothetical protein